MQSAFASWNAAMASLAAFVESAAAFLESITSAEASPEVEPFESCGAGWVPARPSPFDREPLPVALSGKASILYREPSLIPSKIT